MITDYYPIFYTDDIEQEIRRYTEEMGFEVKHRPNIVNLEYAVMENKNKRRIDLVCSHFPADNFKEGFLGMRANVDDFEAGVAFFERQGYSLFGEPRDSGASVTALLTRDDGTYIVVFHHR